jgi:hypothetical protein
MIVIKIFDGITNEEMAHNLYRFWAKQYHPDTATSTEEAEEKDQQIKELNAAWEQWQKNFNNKADTSPVSSGIAIDGIGYELHEIEKLTNDRTKVFTATSAEGNVKTLVVERRVATGEPAKKDKDTFNYTKTGLLEQKDGIHRYYLSDEDLSAFEILPETAELDAKDMLWILRRALYAAMSCVGVNKQ